MQTKTYRELQNKEQFFDFCQHESQKQEKINSIVNKEIIAMIAYLQRLGTDIKPKTSKK